MSIDRHTGYSARFPPSGGGTISLLSLAAVVVLLAANALFVAAEFALVAVERSTIEDKAADGKRSAGSALAALKRLSFYLSACQVGITVSSLLLGFVADSAFGPAIESIFGSGAAGARVAIALAVATVAQMVVGELVPKTLAIAQPVRYSMLLASPLRAVSAPMAPIVALLNGVANSIIRGFGVEPKEEITSARTRDELEAMIRLGGESGTIETNYASLLARSIRFADKDAANALVPRLEVTYLDNSRSVADLVAESTRTGFSRFPVCEGDLDQVVGIAHVKSALGVPADRRAEVPVTDVMTAPRVVPETMDLQELLDELRQRSDQMVIVADEHGGITGILTTEDVVEELVGEIDDEYDAAGESRIVADAAGSFTITGGMHPDDVRDATGFSMPEGDYETIAGFILAELGHIPEVGELVHYDDWTFEVAARERLRISSVRVMAPRAAARAASIGNSGTIGSSGEASP